MLKAQRTIRKILIANRGEIAVRIIRSARYLGIKTVAVYSQADKECLHVKMADEAYCIGPAPSHLSYLNHINIISCAVFTHCDAVHPGVGFLSESANFASQVLAMGLIWIGPMPQTIELLGNKIAAKQSAKKNKVPCIPGTEQAVTSVKEAQRFAEKVGFPIIIKAASGGGGKGMRLVNTKEEMEQALVIASSEAEKAYGDKDVYMEKFLTNPSHFEVQIMGDHFGNVVHLGGRDCTMQKNYQKLLEETPSPNVDPKLAKEICETAVRFMKSLNYVNAGTVEFLVDQNQYYFMEVNTRIQVEHTITEMLTDTDLITEQILIAQEKPLSWTQNDIHFYGYVLEARINALTAGTISEYLPPGGAVRVDSFLYPGYKVSPFYDSMLAKIIVHAQTREQGLQKMSCALKELELTGIQTNVDRQFRLINHPSFKKGHFDIKEYEKIQKDIEV